MSRLDVFKDKFLNKAALLHSNKYSYDMSTYKGSKEPMLIYCPLHGDFKKRPADHIQGQGCPECALLSASRKLTKTHEKFIQDMFRIYGNQLDFSNAKYDTPDSIIEFICPTHDKQMKKASSLLVGFGCSICNGGKLTTKEFIHRAKEVHSNYYSYEKTEYIDSRSNVIITCPQHGEFLQLANGHLNGRGCIKCAEHGFKLDQPAILYYLYIPSINAYKIGITNLSIRKRYLSYERDLFEVIAIKEFDKGIRAYNLEQWLLRRYQKFKYTGYNPLNSGVTEMFTCDIRKQLIESGDLVL